MEGEPSQEWMLMFFNSLFHFRIHSLICLHRLYDCHNCLVEYTGKIVKDTDNFHDDKFIWPEGYTALRKFPSVTGSLFFKDFSIILEFSLLVSTFIFCFCFTPNILYVFGLHFDDFRSNYIYNI